MLKIKVGRYIREVDISKTQYAILHEMFATKSYLVTSEGASYRAWLQRDGTISATQVRTPTAKCLYDGGWIIPSTQNNPKLNHFYYELSSKSRKLFM